MEHRGKNDRNLVHGGLDTVDSVGSHVDDS